MFFRASIKPDQISTELQMIQKQLSDLNAKVAYIITVNELIKAELKHLKQLQQAQKQQ